MPPKPGWKHRAQDADWSVAREKARGRGALSNASSRFESRSHEPFDDGWGVDDEDLAPLQTEMLAEHPKTVITYNSSPDIGFDRTINPYKGCEHGCIYCYARPNHAYWGLSPGLDFETKIFVKPGAATVLARELARRTYKPARIQLGGDTDIYQPMERSLGITRSILEVLSRTRHPVALITKSSLILRDLDIIAPMAAQGLAAAAISLTTLDPRLSRTLEPRAAAPHRRLETIRRLADAGVPVTVMTAPLIPMLNEPELESLLEAARAAGARHAGYVMLRLPLEISGLFRDWLTTHFPDRASRVMKHVQEMRGGKDYDATFHTRIKGDSVYARLVADRFLTATRRLGMDGPRPVLRTDLFRPPAPPDGPQQLSLFDDG